MSYTLTYSGGSFIVTDGSLNNTTSLLLPGRNYSGYGSPVDQDLVYLLENFASSTIGPANAIKGQIWFQPGVGNNFLNYNISDTLGSPTWVKVAGSGVEMDVSFGSVTFVPKSTAPAAPTAGQTYYDLTKEKISYWNNTNWVDLPPAASNYGIYGPGVAIGSNTLSGQINWYSGNTNQMLLWANQYKTDTNKYSSNGYAGSIEFDKTTGAWVFTNSISGNADTALTATQRLTISNNGYVGIGTATPQSNLDIVDISGSGNAYATISNNGNSVLSLNSGVLFDAGGAGSIFTPEAFPLIFGTHNIERVRIDVSGNVGIGGVPTKTLDVNGTFKVSGTVTLNAQTYTFPSTAGTSGYVLTTDGAGTLSWTAASSGSINAASLYGTIPGAVLGNSNLYIGTTAVALNRASSPQTLTGINIDGNAASATTAGIATVANSLTVTNNYQVQSLGVGTAASGTAGEIRATNNITAYYSSDSKFKENIQSISNALSIVGSIGGKTFDWTDEYIAEHGGEDGYFVTKHDFGVVAQDVKAVFPLAVRTREDGTLAVDYAKLSVLALAAILEQNDIINNQEARLSKLEKLFNNQDI